MVRGAPASTKFHEQARRWLRRDVEGEPGDPEVDTALQLRAVMEETPPPLTLITPATVLSWRVLVFPSVWVCRAGIRKLPSSPRPVTPRERPSRKMELL